MASVDSLLENGVTSRTDPGGILSTPPPDLKNAGTSACWLGYGTEGKDGMKAATPATSVAPVATRQVRPRLNASTHAQATTMPAPRKAIDMSRPGSALPRRGSQASAAHGSQIGVTWPSTWRCGPSDSTATITVIEPSHRMAGCRQPMTSPAAKSASSGRPMYAPFSAGLPVKWMNLDGTTNASRSLT